MNQRVLKLKYDLLAIVVGGSAENLGIPGLFLISQFLFQKLYRGVSKKTVKCSLTIMK